MRETAETVGRREPCSEAPGARVRRAPVATGTPGGAPREVRRRLPGPFVASLLFHVLVAVAFAVGLAGAPSEPRVATLSMELTTAVALDEDRPPPRAEPPRLESKAVIEVEPDLPEDDLPPPEDPRFQKKEEDPSPGASMQSPDLADVFRTAGPLPRIRARSRTADSPASTPSAASWAVEGVEAGGETRGAAPVPDLCPAPAYPARDRDRGVEGRVELLVSIDSEGAVLEVEVARSSGSATLDRAAGKTVESWRFHPALRDGAAVASRVLVPFEFRLVPR